MVKSTLFFDWELNFRGYNSRSCENNREALLNRFIDKKTLYKVILFSQEIFTINENQIEEGDLNLETPKKGL